MVGGRDGFTRIGHIAHAEARTLCLFAHSAGGYEEPSSIASASRASRGVVAQLVTRKRAQASNTANTIVRYTISYTHGHS